MGIYSTITISREDAIKSIREKLDTATNEELSSMLFGLLQERILNNYWVVNQYSEDDICPRYREGMFD